MSSDVSVIVFEGYVFFQAEDGIRDLVRSRGLGDVYKRQVYSSCFPKMVPILKLVFCFLNHQK